MAHLNPTLRLLTASLALAMGSLFALPAQGQISEVRGALMAHNIETNVSKNAGKEDGPDMQVEVLWNSPDWLKFAFSPRPGVVASLNTQGETSFATAMGTSKISVEAVKLRAVSGNHFECRRIGLRLARFIPLGLCRRLSP